MNQALIDHLLAWAAKALGDDIVAAKAEYFARTGGELHDEDRSFEPRMQGFFNWYLFDRLSPSEWGARTPVQRFLRERGALMPSQERELLAGAARSRLSLYSFLGRRPATASAPEGSLRLRDPFSGVCYEVVEVKRMVGLELHDLFEARLLPVAGRFLFSTSFLFHSRSVRARVLREVRRRQKARALAHPAAFCWELSKMALQAERFRNVPIDAIYNFETPFLGHKRPRSASDGQGASPEPLGAARGRGNGDGVEPAAEPGQRV